MTAAQPPAKKTGLAAQRAAAESERRCLSTGETLPKERLIRFVVGPDNVVVPDVANALPGRGLWVKANAEALGEAVRRNLFSKAAKESVKVAADLAEQTVRLLRRRCLDHLGLAKGAGLTTLGEQPVGAALKKRELSLLVVADDASQVPGWSDDVPICRIFSRDELGSAFGYPHIVYAGLRPHGLTKRFNIEIKRLTTLDNTSLTAQDNG